MFAFPPTSEALEYPNGLLTAGGDLEPDTLLAAYRRGIFPWFNEGQPILWWSPTPRSVLYPPEFHRSRSLARAMRRCGWSVACDRDFHGVLEACAAPREVDGGTWIVDEMKSAYCRLHRLGRAHSVEVYSGDNLVGGLYGVRLGSVFFGESMFSRRSNASKMALAALVWMSRNNAISLIDCQMETDHLSSMGARAVERAEFENHLSRAITSRDTVPLRERIPLDHQLRRPLPQRIEELV